jgi:hypothetical protein
MTLTTRQPHHQPGDPVTHLDPYPIDHWTTWCGESSSAIRTREMGRVWGGEDGGLLQGAAREATAVGGTKWVS